MADDLMKEWDSLPQGPAAPKSDLMDQWHSLPAASSSGPEVGAGETFVNKSVDNIPLGKTLTSLGTAGVLAAVKHIPGLAGSLGINPDVIKGAGENYEGERKDFDERTAKGAKSNPLAATLGSATGIGLSLAAPVPGMASAESGAANLASKLGASANAAKLVGKYAGGSLAGMEFGAGTGFDNSGTVGGAAKGTGVGLLAGLGGSALAQGLGKVGAWAGKGAEAAQAKADQMAATDIASGIASSKGALGAETQGGSRLIENLLRGESTGSLSEAQAATLQKLKDSGDWQDLVQGVAQRNLDELPDKLSAIKAKQQALADLVANEDQAITDRAADITSPKEALRQIGDRVKRYGPVLAGGVFGKAAHAVTEAGTGFLAGAGLRPALKAVGRAATHPSVQKPLMTAIQSVAERDPAQLGKFAGVMKAAMDRGPEAFASTHYVLAQSNPEYQEKMATIQRPDSDEPEP